MSEPPNDEIRTRPGIGWAYWMAAGIGLLFMLVYAAGGCLMQTIC